jgi:predicted nucleic acid-binding protein
VIEAVLDTNIIIDLINQFPKAQLWQQQHKHSQFAITPIVWMETVQGARNKLELRSSLNFLKQFSLEHSNSNDHLWAMKQVEAFWLNHHLSFSDALIASVAVRLQVPLYTRNVKHFNMLPKLTAAQPY